MDFEGSSVPPEVGSGDLGRVVPDLSSRLPMSLPSLVAFLWVCEN